jgi:hypothetical protein
MCFREKIILSVSSLSIYVKILEFIQTPVQTVLCCTRSGGQVLYIPELHSRCRRGQLLTPVVLHHKKKLHTYLTGEKVVPRIGLDTVANRKFLLYWRVIMQQLAILLRCQKIESMSLHKLHDIFNIVQNTRNK